MAKQQWKKCNSCGRVTDLDERRCPIQCTDSNPGSNLQVVELDKKEIIKLWKGGQLWTKYPTVVERRLSQ